MKDREPSVDGKFFNQYDMSNLETIQHVTDAFDNNDIDALLPHLTDDVEWVMTGDRTVKGKEEMNKMMEDMSQVTLISSTKHHRIMDGDCAVVDGEVMCKTKDGKIIEMFYCDIYELENGKVKKMIMYTVDKKN